MSKEHVDVLIIGAGLSGIGAACHLTRECPGKTYAILEGREAVGGTWDLFRYPGIRSDSDMYTLGYSFKPWTNPKVIADGPSIRDYINETADEYNVRPHIRFGHRVQSANWSSEEGVWTVQARRTADDELVEITAGFVIACTGYYKYEAGYTPEFPGRDSFKGQVIHPQKWPEDLDYRGKRVVIIGSGATAVTLVPAMADQAAHVTMLQRSPTYVATVPEEDPISVQLRRFLPEKMVYRLARTRNVGLQMLVYKLSKTRPRMMRRLLLKQARWQLGKDFDMSHFSPSYNPWDERLCAVPNGDLFKVLKKGKASVVTDHIETFNETGIRLKSGQQLDADIIITATGLDLQLLGGAEINVDGKPFEINQSTAYKALMLSDLPNAAMIFGYTNASWTLKADISCEYICRLLKHMDNTGTRICVPRVPADMAEQPFMDMQSGYIQRAVNKFPKQGDKAPWKLKQNYAFDLAMLRYSKVDDGSVEFANPKPAVKKTAAKKTTKAAPRKKAATKAKAPKSAVKASA
ncbi:monooxygenase flavin-binding family protein [Alcanivorax sp. S71-1-4]|uniref:flavin-containing monooxygenase n=1 Tax=Alcanivorax sp. S71-1-4 TaxID=1177159 RepID=UPI00135A6C11|nr:NAD(P)/FAD-dependent oxidoreductase [Alcanivorax sp. S71-1-4]KAF0810153.1 monooxygenase flavin-binding family protein [Alcanivorax sp. S71-1-4]